MNSAEQELIKKIQEEEDNLDEESVPKLEQMKQQLKEIRENKMQGILIRSGANIIENGEKPTKFICNLETNNYSSKTINVLEQENGVLITNQEEILKETAKYYENLYTSKDRNLWDIDLDTHMLNTTIPKLEQQDANNLEGMLTIEEAGQTLKHMKNNKSPGTSGFLADFFKVFWKDLGHFVERAINYGYRQEELSITQKQGLIICTRKENKNRHFLKNWRPITLLNTVYKIASGSITNRVKKVMNKLISTDQTGFMEGRYIGENTRLLHDIMQYTEEQHIPGLLLLIDFEKAFDSLSWRFIDKVLGYFNFGPSIRKWVSTFYKNSCSAVTQCGFLSAFSCLAEDVARVIQYQHIYLYYVQKF